MSGGREAGADGSSPSPQASSPSPAQANPQLKNALGQLTAMAQSAAQYAKAYPQTAPEMRQIGELIQKVLMKTTQAMKPAEPAAPPV